uniref:HintN domain-containing protein n=1 Tax=Vitiosangium cumulatum TaxID=1867796 RepID=A0A7D5BG15_9BACT|nr:HintN domain-containing protein [Vitiosangium cumulatum]
MNVSLNASSRMLSRFVPALVCLAMLGAGCGQQKVPPQQEEADREALAADSRYMARLYTQWQQAVQSQAKEGQRQGDDRQMPIDLSDDTQYSFVKRRLKAAGSTPENSPQLFRRLEKARKDKKSGIPDTGTRKDMLTSETAGTPEKREWCGHLLPLTEVATSDASVARYQASSFVTCFNGSDYAYADVTAYATNLEQTQFRVLGSQSLEDYASKVLETPPVDLDVKVNNQEMLFVDSVAMAFDEATGESHMSYTVAESSIVPLGGQDVNIIRISHPTQRLGWHVPSDNPIRTCLQRGAVRGSLDCDYASGSVDPSSGLFRPFATPYTGIAAADGETSARTGVWTPGRGEYWEPAGGFDASHLYAAARGEYLVRLPTPEPTLHPAGCTLSALTSQVDVVLMERGGRCTAGVAPGTLVAKGSLPFKAPYFDGYDPTVLRAPFDGLMDFGKDCLNVFQNVKLMLRATVKATCVDPRTGATRAITRSRFQNIDNLDWRNACLAQGTRVTKANGKSVKVEQVKLGDKLLANGQGLALTVTSVSRGGESKPLVKLRDDHGGEVMVTETHPMVTAKRGVVQAGDLKPGEALLTRTGTATLVGVERVPYSGEVFNFALGTPEELARVKPEARTLYANGYLVGDSHMQLTLEKQRALDAREVLTRLHGAWHEDFRLHQARQARR